MTISETFATRLREARQRRRWSQAELAQRVTALGHRLDKATIAKIERAGLEERTAKARRVTIEDAVALAAALDVPLLSLLLPAEDEDLALAPELVLRSRLASAWMAGVLPLRGEDLDAYAGKEMVSGMFLSTDLPRLLREEKLLPDEMTALRAFVAREKMDLQAEERVALRPGAPDELVRMIEDATRKRREDLAEIEQLLATTVTESKPTAAQRATTQGRSKQRATISESAKAKSRATRERKS